MGHKFKLYRQFNEMDCGATCLRMVARYHGRHFNIEGIRQAAGFGKEGVSMQGLKEAAEQIGFQAKGVKLTCTQLFKEVESPCILHWNQNHFVVLLSNKSRFSSNMVKIADPAEGIIKYAKSDVEKFWAHGRNEVPGNEGRGVALLLEPTPAFYLQKSEKEEKASWNLLLRHFSKIKKRILLVFISLILLAFLQFYFPFLTKRLVDKGINLQNLHVITLILLGQAILIFSRTVVEFIKNRLSLIVSTSVNKNLLSDFWKKLTHLPLSHFETRHTGDIIQRLTDNRQLQNFLTGNMLTVVLSAMTFIVYTVVLLQYDRSIFLIFSIGSVLYFFWIRAFTGIRRNINNQVFTSSAKESAATLQLIQGMQEIRLNNAGHIKQKEWEHIQDQLFKLEFKKLTSSQFQQAGATIINQGKDILITYIVAGLVVDHSLTLGTMMAIQYILGQLSNPVEQFVLFYQNAQDAKMSLDRLAEIYQIENEEPESDALIKQLPAIRSILINNISFRYPGSNGDNVLKDLTFSIPAGKTTAIVGVSGSGKTTLLKLLLKYYDYSNGDIFIDGSFSNKGLLNFKHISHSYWRGKCGAVLQDGYIFNDTIMGNIAVSDELPDISKVINSCKTANILPFIESLPNGFFTRLGADGIGLSQGQKQRLLIARAIYKDPDFIFLDEATNALDANNEKIIVHNLETLFVGKTVVIIAHRLSTVKNAEKIIVLEKGTIVEQGTHSELASRKGKYYELVKNQLELDS